MIRIRHHPHPQAKRSRSRWQSSFNEIQPATSRCLQRFGHPTDRVQTCGSFPVAKLNPVRRRTTPHDEKFKRNSTSNSTPVRTLPPRVITTRPRFANNMFECTDSRSMSPGVRSRLDRNGPGPRAGYPSSDSRNTTGPPQAENCSRTSRSGWHRRNRELNHPTDSSGDCHEMSGSPA